MYDCKLEINEKEKDYVDCYIYRAKNSVGQSIFVEINACVNNDFGYNIWSVCFYIADKRKKGFSYKEQTGKDGIKSLLWAKNCIKDFIKEKCRKGDLFIVGWDDVRRKRVYAYGLKDMGFRLGRLWGEQYLMLKIKEDYYG